MAHRRPLAGAADVASASRTRRASAVESLVEACQCFFNAREGWKPDEIREWSAAGVRSVAAAVVSVDTDETSRAFCRRVLDDYLTCPSLEDLRPENES